MEKRINYIQKNLNILKLNKRNKKNPKVKINNADPLVRLP